jgi:hypothetical protein
VNDVPLKLPVTRICRRPPRSAINSAGMSTTASAPGLSSRHLRTRPLKPPCGPASHLRRRSAGLGGEHFRRWMRGSRRSTPHRSDGLAREALRGASEGRESVVTTEPR